MLIWTMISSPEKQTSNPWKPRTSIVLVASHPSRFRQVMIRFAARILGFEAR